MADGSLAFLVAQIAMMADFTRQYKVLCSHVSKRCCVYSPLNYLSRYLHGYEEEPPHPRRRETPQLGGNLDASRCREFATLVLGM